MRLTCDLQIRSNHHTTNAVYPLASPHGNSHGETGADYRGQHVNRAARLRAIAHGEQILISGVTAAILRDALPDGASLIDSGAIVCAIFLSWSIAHTLQLAQETRGTGQWH